MNHPSRVGVLAHLQLQCLTEVFTSVFRLSRQSAWVASLTFFILLSIGWMSPNVLQAQNASQESFIRDLYQSYFQRNPGIPEVNTWMDWFRRGSTAEEIHASIISSDEYFNRIGRDPDRWLTNTYRIVTGANPTVQEFNYWKQRYVAYGMDRRKFGLEFLKAMSNRRPGAEWEQTQPSNVQALSRQLVSQVRNFQTAINRETAGDAVVLRMQTTSLMTAAIRLQTAASANNASSNLATAFHDVQSALAGVQASMRNQAGAFSSRVYLNQTVQTTQQISQILNISARPPIGNPGFYPPVGVPTLPGGVWSPRELQQLNQLTSNLSQEVSSLYYVLRSLNQYDFRYQALMNDMQWYSNQVDQFRNAINSNQNRRTVGRSLQTLTQQAENFNQRISGQNVDVRLRQGFFQLGQTLSQISQVVGGNLGPGNSIPEIPNREALLLEINRAIGQCDRLIAIYSSYVLYGRPVQVFLADLRNTRQQLIVLRSALQDQTELLQVRTDLNAVVTSINGLNQPWGQMSRSIPNISNGDLNELKTSASRLTSLAQ